jgi:uncharacterized protein (DUF1697 family)
VALTIALLRAVNVGGRKLAMADLRQLMADMGFDRVQTLLQSGNLVFDAGASSDAKLEAKLEAETSKRFGLATDFLIRSAAEWGEIVARNPFSEPARDDPSHLVVAVLKAAPSLKAVDALLATIPGREQLSAQDRELYITYPDGIGESKLTLALIERRLGVRGTARNWNTVLKLARMAGA